MVNKIISKVLASVGAQRFSKAVAVPVGAIVGWLVLKLPFLAPLLTEEWVAGLTLAIATLVVGAFPANSPAPDPE